MLAQGVDAEADHEAQEYTRQPRTLVVPVWAKDSDCLFWRAAKRMKINLNARIEMIGGLYVITPDEVDTAELLRKVRLALQRAVVQIATSIAVRHCVSSKPKRCAN
jgi:hypothetical protein